MQPNASENAPPGLVMGKDGYFRLGSGSPKKPNKREPAAASWSPKPKKSDKREPAAASSPKALVQASPLKKMRKTPRHMENSPASLASPTDIVSPMCSEESE